MVLSGLGPVTAQTAENVLANRQGGVDVPPYGQNIFQGSGSTNAAAITDPHRKIGYGDRMLLRMWGAKEFQKIIMVDAEGTIFIPQVGPVEVAGKTLSEAQASIKTEVSKIYKDSVSVHATMADVNPISIFVTGNVRHPGRYEGTQTDTILDYIVRAGGIRPESGSYRSVVVMRNGKEATDYDFYDFIERGEMLSFDFQHGDTIVVEDKKTAIAVAGGALNPNVFEFASRTVSGQAVINMSRPESGVSHVHVDRGSGETDEELYFTVDDFRDFQLRSGDTVRFERDTVSDTISVRIEGEVMGQKAYELKKGASLKAFLSFVQIDPEVVNVDAVHIERPSVARQQKEALQRSVDRLQRQILTAQNSTGAGAQLRSAEARMVESFAKAAAKKTFPGKVVVSRQGHVSDITLRDGDTVIIPRKSDVVMVTGEVTMTNAFLFDEGLRIKDYVSMAGGLTQNADPDRFVVNHPDGRSSIEAADYQVRNGDELIVMPKLDRKNLVMAKEIVGILYQIAVGTRSAVSF